MKQHNDDVFLARWLADELSEEELSEFKKSTAYSEYKEIIEGVDRLETPSYDRQKNFEATLAKIQDQQSTTKVRKLVPNWVYAAAAAIILFIGYTFVYQETTHQTQLAEQTTFELPDGSEVQLNADSKIVFKDFNWDSNRTLELTGEAYFKVKKGSKFTVKTKEGTVSVLGTQFTVNSRPNYYTVTCFEGKVKVEAASETHVLTHGDAFSIQRNIAKKYRITTTDPSWIAQESTFKEVAIEEVVAELERQYNIQVLGKENLKKEYFTGRFTHTNLEQSVVTIFDAMEIPYTFDADGNVSIQKY